MMEKINAVITGVGGYVPDYVLTNEEISRMVDTNDEWIMTRIGVKERRILNEEGLGTSYMARKAAKQLMQKTASNPDDIVAVIVATTTPDYHFPSTIHAAAQSPKIGQVARSWKFTIDDILSAPTIIIFLCLPDAISEAAVSIKYKKPQQAACKSNENAFFNPSLSHRIEAVEGK